MGALVRARGVAAAGAGAVWLPDMQGAVSAVEVDEPPVELTDHAAGRAPGLVAGAS
ncbi:hypothetical protein GCM10010441_07710 [Kitasatospora paracochleata]